MRKRSPFVSRILHTALCAVLLALSIPGAQAAKATPASDTLTRLKVGVVADHEIRFNTPTGVDAPADTIVLTMPDFLFGIVGVGDMDLFYGPATGFENATSLAALAAAGVWGVSIVGTTITFTAPTDAGAGSIPAGNFIGIRIGTNAAGGVNQLTNSAVPVMAQIGIGGTFGDTNLIGVPIVGDDTVSVTATVPSPSPTPPCIGCGGGGGGGSNPPVISNIQVINITGTSARVTWTTDKASNSSVTYGLTVAHEIGTASDAAMVTSHVIDLTGLTPATLYHFIVSSTDATFLTATSGDQTFTTAGGDLTPPVISNVQVVNITDTSALVTWTTDEPATSLVTYGSTIAYGSAALTAGLVTSHAVQLNGLSPSTLYHFFVTSADADANAASSGDAVFTTLSDVTPPTNVSNLTATPGDTIVTLNWTVPPDPDFAGTKIMRKTGGYPAGPFDGTQVFSGPGTSVVDTGLTNGTTYYYGAYAYDSSGNFASGALANATPSGPPPPPAATTTPPIPPPPPPPTPTPTPTPTPLPPTGPGATGNVVAYYYGSGGTIQLVPDASGRIGILAGSAVLVSVPVAGLGNIPSTVTIQVGGSLYSLAKNADGTSYSGTFTAPPPGTYAATVTVTFQNNTFGQAVNTLYSQPSGVVVEETLTGPSTQGVPGATVRLYRDVNGVWTQYGSAQTTNAEGAYGYVVPNGRYYAETEKDGYRKAVTSPRSVYGNVFNDSIPLIRIPVIPPLTGTPAEQAGAAALIAAQQVSYGVKIAREILNSQQIQAANAVAAPALIALMLANAASAISLFNLLAYLQYLFTQPILLFGRRKKRKWGVVFNSLTKQPIDLAIVRLVHFETKLVVQTKVTDKYGRYWFVAGKGNFLIEVVKPGYVFPTQYLADKKEDVEFADLYHGDKIEAPGGEIIAMNIPLDPVAKEETPSRVLLRKTAKVLRHSVAFSGVLFGMVVLVVTPSAPSAFLLLAQIGIYLLFRRLALPVKAKSWGITFDARSRKPVGGVIVRIFDKKFNKLLETQVTDANGKYGFFVRRNVYYVTAEKKGYKRYQSPDIDLSAMDEALVDQNVSLEPE